MALFARRFLQYALDESQAYLSVEQRRDLCKHLNTVHDNYLAKEWEITLLHALNGLGTLQYEPDFPGTRHPDILYTAEDGLTFVADITAVSDRGLHKENPYDALQQEFFRRQKKSGMLHGGFDVRVNSYPTNNYRGSGQKPRLKLPKIADFPTRVFNADFQAFMNSVRTHPDKERQLKIEDEEVSIHFSYSPSRRGFGGGSHPAFDLTAIVDRNPVYNALSSKADQLRESGYSGMMGVILCDAGCWSLHQDNSTWEYYGRNEVVGHFLRQTQTVSFVVVLIVEDEQHALGLSRRQLIKSRLYVNSHAMPQKEALEQFVARLGHSLPCPEQTPKNAILQLKRKDGMTGRHLGALTHGGSIEMSARMLLEILAGQLSVDDFEQNYRMKNIENPFRIKLQQGRLIDQITVDHHPEKDDDRVTIHFGKPDAAIAPFTYE
jgi:hypothetical protein